ncbi:MAG: DJ-1/PfpI family protein, partial [Aminivibrio sp.]
KKATSFISIRDDMILAGADWVDEPVVVSGKLVTSRTPADLPYFGRALLEALK